MQSRFLRFGPHILLFFVVKYYSFSSNFLHYGHKNKKLTCLAVRMKSPVAKNASAHLIIHSCVNKFRFFVHLTFTNDLKAYNKLRVIRVCHLQWNVPCFLVGICFVIQHYIFALHQCGH